MSFKGLYSTCSVAVNTHEAKPGGATAGEKRSEKVNVSAAQLGVAERARLHAGRPGFQAGLCCRQPPGCLSLTGSLVSEINVYLWE